MQAAIVFVHLGPRLPTYLRDALAQARAFNRCPILLIAHRATATEFPIDPVLDVEVVDYESLEKSEQHARFTRAAPLDRSFRDGFWTYTSERFFCLESLLQRRSFDAVVHLESDNLIYVDLDEILPVLVRRYPGLAAPFDNDWRCVPGFVFLRNLPAIAALTAFFNTALESRILPQPNDMLLCGAFHSVYGASAIGRLPIVTPDYPAPLRSLTGQIPAAPKDYSQFVTELGSIFDAAAFGQFLGGIDPRNSDGRDTIGFINENCIFDPSRYAIEWTRDGAGRRVPFAGLSGARYRINNLHIHSKELARFR